VDKTVMEVDNPIIFQSKSHRMSLGCSKRHSKKIHKNSQQTLAINPLFLHRSQSDCGCSTTACLGQLQNLTATNVNLINDNSSPSNPPQTRDEMQQTTPQNKVSYSDVSPRK